SCSHSISPSSSPDRPRPDPPLPDPESPPLPCSGMQQRTTPGTLGAHGFGSQVSTLTPLRAAHSDALVCSHSPSSSPAMQQPTSSSSGGVVAQGFGMQDAGPGIVPPSPPHPSGFPPS